MGGKPKVAMYWAASCGGCEISLVNVHEKILDFSSAFDLFFCPCLVDTKKKDIEALKDGSLAVTLFNGAIRTDENAEMARLLRRKSKVLIAYGSCAVEGCIPGLANLTTKDEILRTVYTDNPTTDNTGALLPQTKTITPDGMLEIPVFHNRVKPLADEADVDYFIAGCPPESNQISAILDILITGKPLPMKGSFLGSGTKTVCEECKREKNDKKIKNLYRTYEIIPEPVKCLLEQGIICMGISTKNGCGAPCPDANMPCTGCYGPASGIVDHGAKMASALGSIIDLGPVKGLSEDEIAKKTDDVLDAIPDYAGTFYKYSLAGSILKGKVK